MSALFYVAKFGIAKIASIVSTLLGNFASCIPDCPFEQFIQFSDDMKIMHYLNYFVPFDNFLVILQGWIVYVIMYLCARLISGTLRDVPFIGSLLDTIFK